MSKINDGGERRQSSDSSISPSPSPSYINQLDCVSQWLISEMQPTYKAKENRILPCPQPTGTEILCLVGFLRDIRLLYPEMRSHSIIFTNCVT